MKPELCENLEVALHHAEEIQKFVYGMTLERYSEDEKTRLTVERPFEIIGEAPNRCYKISPEKVDAIFNYRQIISFRNILAHCYDSIENKIVWGIIEDSLPRLIANIAALLA